MNQHRHSWSVEGHGPPGVRWYEVGDEAQPGRMGQERKATAPRRGVRRAPEWTTGAGCTYVRESLLRDGCGRYHGTGIGRSRCVCA